MDFDLTSDQRAVQMLARELAEGEIVPHAAEWDREHRFPRRAVPEARGARPHGRVRPGGVRGRGRGLRLLCPRPRGAVARGRGRRRHRRRPHERTTLPILAFGTDEQRARFVPPLARGESLGAFALTEPDAGSDAGSLRTTAAPDGDGWVLNGSKQWITNGFARHVPVFARTDPAPWARGSPASSSTPGTSGDARGREARPELLDTSTSSSRTAVERDRLLHEEGRGFPSRWRRSTPAASGSPPRRSGSRRPRTTSRACTRWSGASSGGGSAISRRSSGSSRTWRRRSTPRACSSTAPPGSSRRAGRTREGARRRSCSPRRWRGGQTAEAIQILGGYGYTKEFPVERYYRDAKITEIYEGTSEIQRLVIARSILGRQLARSRSQPREPRARRARPPDEDLHARRRRGRDLARRRLARLQARLADRGLRHRGRGERGTRCGPRG